MKAVRKHTYENGMEIEYDGSTVLVITPQSPLGKQLIGAKEGNNLQIEIGGVRNDYRVLSVA